MPLRGAGAIRLARATDICTRKRRHTRADAPVERTAAASRHMDGSKALGFRHHLSPFAGCDYRKTVSPLDIEDWPYPLAPDFDGADVSGHKLVSATVIVRPRAK